MTSLSGWLALLCLGLSALSGALLAWHYQPAELGAYASVVTVENAVRGGAWLRSLHYLSTQLALGLAILHLAAVVLVPRAERSGTRTAAGFASGLLALVLTALCAFSGRVLPWDQHGGLSLVMLGEFFRFGVDPLAGLSSGALRLPRVFLLHLLGTLLLGISLGVHLAAPARARVRSWLEGGGRWVARTTFGAVLAVVALAAWVPAPLGEPFALPTVGAETAVAAEWYLRWLQFLSLRSVPLARVALLGALVLVLATPLYSRRVGPRGLRMLWGGVVLFALLTSLLPARPS